MRVYLSGPISGHEETADERFDEAAAIARAMNHEPVNPMRLPAPKNGGMTRHCYMKRDLCALLDCDAIYMLSNWRSSKGARIEFAVAALLGLVIMFHDMAESHIHERIKEYAQKEA